MGAVTKFDNDKSYKAICLAAQPKFKEVLKSIKEASDQSAEFEIHIKGEKIAAFSVPVEGLEELLDMIQLTIGKDLC